MIEKEKEIWKNIPNYEGYYQASNLGRVSSVDRWLIMKNNKKRFFKGRVVGVSNKEHSKGYNRVNLCKIGQSRGFYVSQVVAMAFLGHVPNGHDFIIDHINGIRDDDRLENLRIATQRENLSICFRSDKKSLSSKYVGVSFFKKIEKWASQIYYKDKNVIIGYFKTELEASNAYQLALSKVKDGTFNPEEYKPVFTSKHRGISFHKGDKRWQMHLTINGKQKFLGSCKTEEDAYNALESYKREHCST